MGVGVGVNVNANVNVFARKGWMEWIVECMNGWVDAE